MSLGDDGTNSDISYDEDDVRDEDAKCDILYGKDEDEDENGDEDEDETLKEEDEGTVYLMFSFITISKRAIRVGFPNH